MLSAASVPAWAIAENDDGRIFFTEGGTIRVIENGRLNPQPVAIISPICTVGQKQVCWHCLGLTFQKNGYVYAMHT